MKRHSPNRKVAHYAVGSTLAALLIAGAGGAGLPDLAGSGTAIAAESTRSVDKAIVKAERAVEKAPRDAAVRVMLGHTYLQGGRFESAAQTFRDAQFLGDESPRTALSLALAHIAAGKDREALAVLGQWRDVLPAGDLGLAMALAGDTQGGVAVLADALRAGDDTVSLRQNLAYAYALDGRWQEARLMAAQDVPADQLDARISTWARQARPDQYRDRVAALLGTPVRNDPGQPAHLALAPAAVPAPALAAAPPALPLDASGELPALATTDTFWTQAAAAEPETAPIPTGFIADDPAPTAFAEAFIDTAPASDVRFVSQPVVQIIPAAAPARARPVAETSAPAPAVSRETAAVEPVRSAPAAAAQGYGPAATHVVQLGSFSSEANAERAWSIYLARHPELAGYSKVITPAVVRGKKYYRVTAAGFERGAAMSMCRSVKGRGHGCLAYAATNPLPGALPGTAAGGPMRARR